MKKYELTDEIIEYEGRILHRIKALVEIPSLGVSVGTLGGWVESELNLSHKGDCWVSSQAMVYGDARVEENAKVYGYAKVSGNAKVVGNAVVNDYAKVSEHAWVYGNAYVCEQSEVSGCAEVFNYTKVSDYAKVCGCARVRERAWVFGHAVVDGDASVGGDTEVYGHAWVHGDSRVYGASRVGGDAEVYEHATVRGAAKVYGSAKVRSRIIVNGNARLGDGNLSGPRDYICCGPIGSRSAYTTFNKTTGTVCTGCFKGTLDEFEKAVEKDHKGTEHYKEYKDLIAYFKTFPITKHQYNDDGKK